MIWRWEVVSNWIEDPQLGAEIGVRKGKFTAYLLKRFKTLTIYAVDPWVEQPEGSETYLSWDFDAIYREFLENIKPYKNRTKILREFSWKAVEYIKDKSLDFVFIDAQHDYESVRDDIELWTPKVKPGGLLSGHDYCQKFPGVIKAVNEVQKPRVGDNSVWGIWV